MKFNSKDILFGGHETFQLRYSWLSKGYKQISKDKDFFKQDEASVVLGVGKNMASSIKFWLKSFRVVNYNSFEITRVGKLIFDQELGLDPFLEDDSTIWLLHWLISSNPKATPFFFLFNKFHKLKFNIDEVISDLSDYLVKYGADNKRPPINTLKKDIQMIIRMYSNEINLKSPEDSINSPLANLNLFYKQKNQKNIRSNITDQSNIPINIVAFALTELMESESFKSLPLNELLYTHGNLCSLGSIFKLTEDSLFNILEEISLLYPNDFQVRESSGINQIFKLREIDPFIYLKNNYKNLNQAA